MRDKQLKTYDNHLLTANADMRSTGLLQYSGASLIHGSQVYISSQQMIIIGFLVVYLSHFIV